MRRIPFAILLLLAVGNLTPSVGADQEVRSSFDRSTLDAKILVAQFERAIRSRDLDRFTQDVWTTFRQSSLTRMVRNGSTEERRAAVYALGVVGTFEANAAVAQGLKDRDAVVRAMADRALRAIWFRADTPENNERLRKIMVAIELQRFGDAVKQVDELVKLSPDFAEAYNQRAIIYYATGRLTESIEDCQRTVERNPYHLGALSGMGQCYLRIGQKMEALSAFRKAFAIDPYNESLKATIDELELGN